MKTLWSFIWLLLFAMFFASFMFFLETRKSDSRKKIIDSLTHYNGFLKHQNDSTERALVLTRDSLRATFQVLQTQIHESEKAKKQTALQRKQYESIIFKRFDSDTARLRAWSELYPTLSNR